jgi:hypothetical protein
VKVPAALGVIVCVPLAASVPLQPPEAVQLVALTDDQAMVVELPATTELAASLSVGAAGAVAVTTVVAVLDVLLLSPPPLTPPQAAIKTVTKVSKPHRGPLPARLTEDAPLATLIPFRTLGDVRAAMRINARPRLPGLSAFRRQKYRAPMRVVAP